MPMHGANKPTSLPVKSRSNGLTGCPIIFPNGPLVSVIGGICFGDTQGDAPIHSLAVLTSLRTLILQPNK